MLNISYSEKYQITTCVVISLKHKQIKSIKQEDAGERVAAKAHGASRRVGVGSQILQDLGVQKMALFSSQKKYYALSGFGLEVVEYIAE